MCGILFSLIHGGFEQGDFIDVANIANNFNALRHRGPDNSTPKYYTKYGTSIAVESDDVIARLKEESSNDVLRILRELVSAPQNVIKSSVETFILTETTLAMHDYGMNPPRDLCWNINGIFMGAHRLAIINQTETGNQPLELDKTVLICNGQIYNYVELAKQYAIPLEDVRSDVDIILHLYKKLCVEDIVRLLDGDFAFVLYDFNTNTVHMARDIAGVRPLFYAMSNVKKDENENEEEEVRGSEQSEQSERRERREVERSETERILVAAASEVKGLSSMRNVSISVFPPGRYMRFDYGTALPGMSKLYISEFNRNAQREMMVNLLRTAVAKRIDCSERPVAFLCSGGLDSSIILCIANEYLKNTGREMHVFSMKYVDAKGNCHSDDESYCKLLVEHLGVKYTSLSFTLTDAIDALEDIIYHTETCDPITIRTSVPMYLMAKQLRNTTDYKVFLSGEGADELFCGYLYFKQAKMGAHINDESARLVQNIHMFDILKADRCFNAFGLEIRVPFLDKDLINYVLQMDGELKMFQNSVEKAYLRRAFAARYPVLTETRIIDRPKERFSDGVSFSYIPDLLNYCSRSRYSTLEAKEQCEREYYKAIYDQWYGGLDSLVAARDMPEWCVNDKKEVVNMGMNSAAAIPETREARSLEYNANEFFNLVNAITPQLN